MRTFSINPPYEFVVLNRRTGTAGEMEIKELISVSGTEDMQEKEKEVVAVELEDVGEGKKKLTMHYKSSGIGTVMVIMPNGANRTMKIQVTEDNSEII